MVWSCCTCISKYTSRSQLSLHLESHADAGGLDLDHELCMSCNRTKESHLIYSSECILYCAHCDEIFLEKRILRLHIHIEHSKRKLPWYLCSACNKLFMRTQDFSKHMEDVHCQFQLDVEPYVVSKLQDITFPCQVCGVLCVLSKYCVDHESFAPASSSSTLTSNTNCIEHGSLYPYCHSCQKCDESFDNCRSLWSHMFLNHEDADFVCNLCDADSKKIVKYPHLLVRHFKFHHAMSLVLPLVHKSMMNRTEVLVDGTPKYQCPECSAVIQDFRGLKAHLQIHSGDREYVCPLCKKLFFRKTNLDNHIKSVHQKIREYKCPECGRGFFNSSNLIPHMRIHSGVKKFVCDVCGESFTHWGSLKQHSYLHGEAKFDCRYCGKSYKNPKSLASHVRNVHTEFPKSVCDVCGKEFKKKKLLTEHMAVHTSDRPFECDLCPSAFKTKKHLRQHYKKHIKIDMAD
ncbi:hypothetical protein WDU94_012803 [Cyamophila willieti]